MTDAVPSIKRQKRLGYWWAPVALMAVTLAVAAFLLPYRELDTSDVAGVVLESTAALDKTFGAPAAQALKYSTRRTYSRASGPMEVEIRATLHPLGHGLVVRQDDWYDVKGRSVVYQERFILFRNLVALRTRSREVAPFVHDLMGRVGWYNDSVQSLKSEVSGAGPAANDWKLDVATDRLSDTDGKGLLLQSTPYQRRLHCEHKGDISGAEIGAGLTGSYPKVSCSSASTNQPAQRQSEYAYLPDYGIFLLLGFSQKAENAEKLEARGNYLSFEVVPKSF